ncbi:MAG: hypothetical protein ABW184_06055 [Sphingobium sp.]
MTAAATQSFSIAPNLIERVLAILSGLLGVVVVIAVARGHAEWGYVPPVVWVHLLAVLVAVALTPVLLLRPRGDRMHRIMGWVWATAMFLTAAVSFGVRLIRPGHFSLIHILSAFTVAMVPLLVLSARRHKVAEHRRRVRLMITGALLIAGFFTFPFDRLLGHWLFS